MSNIKRTPTEDPIVDRIEELLKIQKKTKKGLMEYLGLETSIFTLWRYVNGKSYMKHIDKISEYLGVNVNYLLYGDQSEQTIVVEEKQEIDLIKYFRVLDSAKKESILNLLKSITV